MAGKETLRQEVWSALEEAGVTRFPGARGRIPNFRGAEEAARRLAATAAWRRAGVLKANPDSPQWPVRTRALEEGKVVYMAVPRLAEERPFWRLDPAVLDVAPRQASSIKGAARHGEPVSLGEMERIDLVVCGSVAVDRHGARLGKGGGYSDLEFGLVSAAGLVGESTVVATTVHPLQILAEGRIPVLVHDFPVEVVATPDEVLEIEPSFSRPSGILWGDLPAEKAEAIPVLGTLSR